MATATPDLKPNKARFKAAVVGCIRASGEEELEMWCELLRDEIALFQELENLQKDDRDEIAAFFGVVAKREVYDETSSALMAHQEHMA